MTTTDIWLLLIKNVYEGFQTLLLRINFFCVLAIGDRKLDFHKRIIWFGTKSIYLCRYFLEAITQSHFGKEVFFHSHHIPIPV